MSRDHRGEQNRRITSVGRFNLGGAAAETDPLLANAFYPNPDYETIASQDDPSVLVVGRTGSGKSAAFDNLQRQYPGKVILLNPENLALPYLTNLDVIRQLTDLGVHLDPFFRALWKHVILVEVLRNRYRITDEESKFRVLEEIKRKLKSDPGRGRALDYLNEFGDRFWCETHERVMQIAEMFRSKVESQRGADAALQMQLPVATATAGIRTGTTTGVDHSIEARSELTSKYQRIVQEAQLPRLNEMIIVLNDTILDSPQNFTYLLIDDLDKDWVEGSHRVRLIRCLLDAVIDMAKVRHLKVVVALRTNIFHQLDYGSLQYGHQEEKIRGMMLPLQWTKGDLRSLVEQRVRAASEHFKLDPPLTLEGFLPNRGGRGDALDYVFERTMLRPRDVIMYLNAAVRVAGEPRKLTWEHLTSAELEYSKDRLNALRDEWRDPYLDIDKALEKFRGSSAEMTQEELSKSLDDIALLPADTSFRGNIWLSHLTEKIFEGNNSGRSWEELYGPLVRLLFDIGFLGVSYPPSYHDMFSYNLEAKAQQPALDLRPTTRFVIHKAYRAALYNRVPHRQK
jgi:hypothetical protein